MRNGDIFASAKGILGYTSWNLSPDVNKWYEKCAVQVGQCKRQLRQMKDLVFTTFWICQNGLVIILKSKLLILTWETILQMVLFLFRVRLTIGVDWKKVNIRMPQAGNGWTFKSRAIIFSYGFFKNTKG